VRGRVALSEPGIVRRLQSDFIPAVGEHIALTRGPLSEWWDAIVKSANPQYRGGSTQGYYIVSGDGRGILWDNYLPRLSQFLERGLAMYRDSGRPPASVPPDWVRAAAPAQPPAGASILRLFTRIRPLPSGAGPMNAMLGRDYMWVLSDEVREMAAASGRGLASFAMPETLVARLIVFHLVDNVRGQVWPWQPQSVREANFTARKVRDSGAIRTISFTGRFAKRDSHPPQWTDRGQEGTVEGEFDIDSGTNRIARFRALADCQAWSDASYDRASAPPAGRYPILTAIVEANDDLSRRVPPEQASAGAYYLRPHLR
jgi:hypothetical protein